MIATTAMQARTPVTQRSRYSSAPLLRQARPRTSALTRGKTRNPSVCAFPTMLDGGSLASSATVLLAAWGAAQVCTAQLHGDVKSQIASGSLTHFATKPESQLPPDSPFMADTPYTIEASNGDWVMVRPEVLRIYVKAQHHTPDPDERMTVHINDLCRSML